VLFAIALLSIAGALVLPERLFAEAPGLARIEVATGALAILGGVAAAVRSRVDGYAPAWWIGLTLLAVGVPCLAGGTDATSPPTLHVAAGLVALMCATRAVCSPEVDTAFSPVGSVIGTVSLLLATSLFYVVLEDSGTKRATAIVLTIGFAALALLVAARARTDRDAVWPGLAPLLVGLSLVNLLAVTSSAAQPLRSGMALVLLATTCLAVVQIVGDLRAAGHLQRSAAYESHLLRRRAEDDRRAVEHRFAETLHEVRSTVRALEGGVRGLDCSQRSDDAPYESSALTRALVGEVERLRLLITDDHQRAGRTRYKVAHALEPMLMVSVSGGLPVDWEIPDELEASGRPADLAQVVHGLLVNATRYAPSAPIDVIAHQDGDFVVVHVDDRGPGVDRAARELIFERGVRASDQGAGEGLGLGLHIARSVMRREGGDVWAEPRPGGGARFVVALPVAREDALYVNERRLKSVSPQ
jgi:signal transduction histidine kinase